MHNRYTNALNGLYRNHIVPPKSPETVIRLWSYIVGTLSHSGHYTSRGSEDRLDLIRSIQQRFPEGCTVIVRNKPEAYTVVSLFIGHQLVPHLALRNHQNRTCTFPLTRIKAVLREAA